MTGPMKFFVQPTATDAGFRITDSPYDDEATGFRTLLEAQAFLTTKVGEQTCIYCGKTVTVGAVEAGSTNMNDFAWVANGDYGCDPSPDTTDEGVGSHEVETREWREAPTDDERRIAALEKALHNLLTWATGSDRYTRKNPYAFDVVKRGAELLSPTGEWTDWTRTPEV